MVNKSSDFENTDLQATVEETTDLKALIVEYVGEQHHPTDDKVTVEMVVETFAKEFPEFMLAVAEENWVRGYAQGVADNNPIVKRQYIEEVNPSDVSN